MSAEVRANEILSRIKLPAVGVEIGVAIGQTSEALLKESRIKLFMVDSWAAEDEQSQSYKDSGDYHAHLTREQQNAHMETARKVTEFAGDRRVIVRMPSVEASKTFEDHTLDFVFIDGDHSYEGCRDDIEAWKDKVKPGGILSGHDYGHQPTTSSWTTGPKQAVDEAVKKYGWELKRGENYTWFVKI